MKLSAVFAVVGLFAIAGATQAATHSATTQQDEHALSNAQVSLTEAISAAQEQGNGQAVSADYNVKHGTAGYYDVKVLSSDGQKLTRYRIAADTGKVISTDNEPIEKVFTRLKPESLRNAPTSMKQAITTAEEKSGGKAMGASIHSDGDQVQYTVHVAKADGSTEKVTVNGSNGRVASAK